MTAHAPLFPCPHNLRTCVRQRSIHPSTPRGGWRIGTGPCVSDLLILSIFNNVNGFFVVGYSYFLFVVQDGAKWPQVPSGKGKLPVTYVTLDEARLVPHKSRRI